MIDLKDKNSAADCFLNAKVIDVVKDGQMLKFLWGMIKENNRKQNSDQLNKKLAKYIDHQYQVLCGDEEPPIYIQNLSIIASNIPSTFGLFKKVKYEEYENVEKLLKSKHFYGNYWLAVYGADKLKDVEGSSDQVKLY